MCPPQGHMKFTTLVPAVIAAACAAAAIYLGSELSVTRERLAHEQQARAADAAHIHQLEEERRRFRAPPDLATRDFTAPSAEPKPPLPGATPPAEPLTADFLAPT